MEHVMAESRVNPANNGDAAPKPAPERARQGQNVKGMIWVLVVGIALVVLAYAVMLALSAQPVTPDGRSLETQSALPPAVSSDGSGAVPPETAQSPN
jgi:hypothetical protein